MSYHLFLDDIRDPSWVHWQPLPALPDSQWVVARDYPGFVETVTAQGIPAFVSFDHDLDAEGMAEDHRTGTECAQWLWAHCQAQGVPFPSYTIHSFNRPEALALQAWLDAQGAPPAWAA